MKELKRFGTSERWLNVGNYIFGVNYPFQTKSVLIETVHPKIKALLSFTLLLGSTVEKKKHLEPLEGN